MLSTKTNSVAKTVNTKTVKKVVAKSKPQTDAQKQATAKTRALNPQWANVQSAQRKTDSNAFKTDAILCLSEVKRTIIYPNFISFEECISFLHILYPDINVRIYFTETCFWEPVAYKMIMAVYKWRISNGI